MWRRRCHRYIEAERKQDDFQKTLENISYYLDWPVVIACIVRQIIMKIITANIQSGVGKRQVVEHIPRVKHEAEHGN